MPVGVFQEHSYTVLVSESGLRTCFSGYHTKGKECQTIYKSALVNFEELKQPTTKEKDKRELFNSISQSCYFVGASKPSDAMPPIRPIILCGSNGHGTSSLDIPIVSDIPEKKKSIALRGIVT